MKSLILKINIVIVLLGVLFFSITSCHSNEDGHAHENETAAPDDHADEMEEHGDEVGLTKEQIKKIGLQLGSFEQKNLQSKLKVNGLLELPPQNKASVSALAAGKISQIKVKPGQYVKKGNVLATILNPDLINWQQEYLEVQGELMFLEKEYVRQKDLVAKEIAPVKQLEKVESERAIAKAKLQGLSSRLNVIGIPIPTAGSSNFTTFHSIRSPINGFVRAIKVNTGIYIEPQQDLFEIVDNHHLHIDFMVFEKDLPFLKKGQIITFSLQSQPKNTMQAKVFAIGKAINEENRSISVHAEIIDDKAELIPGMYVEGRIILEDKKVAALPEEAIAMDKGLPYIFVKEEEHEDEIHFMKIPILQGAGDLGYVEVTPLEKLEPSAEIVTVGAYFLMAQSKKGEEGAGHHH